VRRVPLLLAALVLAGCGSSSASPPAPSPPRFDGVRVPHTPAPPIALHDAAGRRVTLARQRGGWTLVTFLYTHCPDVCPLIASNLNQALRLIDAPKHHVSVLAVSVDPVGDTPAAVRAYARRMHLVPRFRFLIGTRAQLHPIWTRYHVVAAAAGANLVDHLAYTVLVDPQGRERLVYDASVKAAQVVHDLRVLLHTSNAA
jgi:protein SCO1/2